MRRYMDIRSERLFVWDATWIYDLRGCLYETLHGYKI